MTILTWVHLLLSVLDHMSREVTLLLKPLVTLMAFEFLKPGVDIRVV